LGAILEYTQLRIPSAYQTLAGSTAYGEEGLQAQANYVQYRLFATVAGATQEGEIYDPLELDFMSKLVSLRVLPAAVDTVGGSGGTTSTEIVLQTRTERRTVTSPSDRAKSYWDSYEAIRKSLVADMVILRHKFVAWGKLTGIVPAIIPPADELFITPSPDLMGSALPSGWPPSTETFPWQLVE